MCVHVCIDNQYGTVRNVQCDKSEDSITHTTLHNVQDAENSCKD